MQYLLFLVIITYRLIVKIGSNFRPPNHNNFDQRYTIPISKKKNFNGQFSELPLKKKQNI